MVQVRTPRPASARSRVLSPPGVALVVALGLAVPGVANAAMTSRYQAHAASASVLCPWVDSQQPIAQRVADVIENMTLADEITMVEGAGTTNPYVFYMPGIPRLCIPYLAEEDGPAGVADQMTGVTQLPAGVAVAATWDSSLANQYGQVIGSEEAGKGGERDRRRMTRVIS